MNTRQLKALITVFLTISFLATIANASVFSEKYIAAAEQGDAKAQCNLGDVYHSEWMGEQNLKEAFKWYKKAAEQGLGDAQLALGKIYYTGEGIEKNYKEAFKWLEKAAKQDIVYAQFTLGEMYYAGEGVEKNYE